jgi:hypothetical protein
MFHDLDATLATLLRAELGMANVAVSFAAPDDQFPPSGVALPAVSLFLYDIRENTELRSNEWEHERRPDGTTTRKRPPVRVDCSYLITAWPSDATTDPADDEHRLLGEVMKVLLRHRLLPEAYLQGELEDQEPPLRTKILAENQLQSLGELWQAMGGKPKATLQYGVTVSVDVFEPVDVGPEVTERITTLHQGVDRPGDANDDEDDNERPERARLS